MNIEIMSRKDYQKRTLSIVKGEYIPKKGEPKIWFESIKSLSQVLSNENQKLLELIIEHKPRSLTELVLLSDRKKSNLSRTLKTLERYGIVSLKKESGKVIPSVHATDFNVKFGLSSATLH